MPDRYHSLIRRVPMFANLPPAQFEQVARAFQTRSYQPGELIVQQYQPTRGLHILVNGQALMYQMGQDGRQHQVGALQGGQYINDDALLRDSTEAYTLQAVRPVTALFLRREEMARLLSQDRGLRQALGLERGTDHHMHDVHFETQREDEQVLMVTRRHWWLYARFLPLALIVFIALFAGFLLLDGIVRWVMLVLSLILPGAMALYLYIEWANDAVIITDQRVLRITRNILRFSEVINEVALESIHEVRADIPPRDILANVLNYGTVVLNTAGQTGDMLLPYTPRPREVQTLILEDVRNHKDRRQNYDRQAMRADLDRWLDENPTAPVDNANGDDGGSNMIAKPPPEKRDRPPLSPFVSKFRNREGHTVFRKHWLIWLRAIALPGTVLLMSLVLTFLNVTQVFGGLSVVTWLLDIGLFIVGVLWLYYADWDWRHDFYIVTDETITLVHQRPLFLQNERDQILLSQVDNVIAETSGFWQQFFRYGDVRVALEGGDNYKMLDSVHKPVDVQGYITSRQSRAEQREAQNEERRQREIIGEYLSAYHERQYNEQPDNAVYTPPPQRQGGYQQAQPSRQEQPYAPNTRNYQPRIPQARQTPTASEQPVNRPSMSPGRPYQSTDPYRQSQQPPQQTAWRDPYRRYEAQPPQQSAPAQQPPPQQSNWRDSDYQPPQPAPSSTRQPQPPPATPSDADATPLPPRLPQARQANLPPRQQVPPNPAQNQQAQPSAPPQPPPFIPGQNAPKANRDRQDIPRQTPPPPPK